VKEGDSVVFYDSGRVHNDWGLIKNILLRSWY